MKSDVSEETDSALKNVISLSNLETELAKDYTPSLPCDLLEQHIMKIYIKDYDSYSIKATLKPIEPRSLKEYYFIDGRLKEMFLSYRNMIGDITNLLNKDGIYADVEKSVSNIINLGNGRFISYNGHTFEYITNEYKFSGKNEDEEELVQEEIELARKCLEVIFKSIGPLFSMKGGIEKNELFRSSPRSREGIFKKSLLVEKYKNKDISNIVRDKKFKAINIFLGLYRIPYTKKRNILIAPYGN